MYGIRGVSKEEIGLYGEYRRLQVVFSAPKNPIVKFFSQNFNLSYYKQLWEILEAFFFFPFYLSKFNFLLPVLVVSVLESSRKSW